MKSKSVQSAENLTFIETPVFERVLADYMNDDEYHGLQSYLREQPEAGDLIPRSGGCRKLRWHTGNRGKRGGLRVIYYLARADGTILMVTMYGKTDTENVEASVLRKLLELYR